LGLVQIELTPVKFALRKSAQTKKKAGSFLIPLQKLTEVNVKFSVLSDCRALACI